MARILSPRYTYRVRHAICVSCHTSVHWANTTSYKEFFLFLSTKYNWREEGDHGRVRLGLASDGDNLDGCERMGHEVGGCETVVVEKEYATGTSREIRLVVFCLC